MPSWLKEHWIIRDVSGTLKSWASQGVNPLSLHSVFLHQYSHMVASLLYPLFTVTRMWNSSVTSEVSYGLGKSSNTEAGESGPFLGLSTGRVETLGTVVGEAALLFSCLLTKLCPLIFQLSSGLKS